MANKSQTNADRARRKEIADCLVYKVTPEMAREIKRGNIGAYMPLLLSWYDTLESLDSEDFKRFILDSMKYHTDGALPEYKKGSTLFVAWTMAKGTYDNLLKSYAKQCETNWKNKTASDIFQEEQGGLSQQEIMERHPEYRPLATTGNEPSPNRNRISNRNRSRISNSNRNSGRSRISNRSRSRSRNSGRTCITQNRNQE